jgi:hypothetical protein
VRIPPLTALEDQPHRAVVVSTLVILRDNLYQDAHIRPMMDLDVLEPLPSRTIPYAQVDPFILVHEAVVPITEERASLDTKHPHRGFDNLWYLRQSNGMFVQHRMALDDTPPQHGSSVHAETTQEHGDIPRRSASDRCALDLPTR